MRKEPKRLRPLVALAMIDLAARIDKCGDREMLVRASLQYGKCVNLGRDESEWVLGHTVLQVYRREWRLEKAERIKHEERMRRRRKA
jgi:hypothetical protein